MKKFSSEANLHNDNSDEEDFSYYTYQPTKKSIKNSRSTEKIEKLIETGKRLLKEGKIPQALESYSSSKKISSQL